MNGPELLEHAAGLVNRRRREYGEPVDVFEAIAKRWSLSVRHQGQPRAGRDRADRLKLARLTRDPKHLDSHIDVAGYAGCLGEVLAMHELPQASRPSSGQPLDAEAEKRRRLARAGHPGRGRAGPAPHLARLELIGTRPTGSTAGGRRTTDERRGSSPHKVPAASSRRCGRWIPMAGSWFTTGRSTPWGRCFGRARSRRRCTMPRATSRPRSSSPIWTRSARARSCGCPGPGREPDLNERQIDARRRVHAAMLRRWAGSTARRAPACGTSSACSERARVGDAQAGVGGGAAGAGARILGSAGATAASAARASAGEYPSLRLI